VSRVAGKLAMNLGMAREVDKHARKPSSIEIHRDRITIANFLDSRVVGQHMKTGKTVNLEAGVDPIALLRRCF